MKLELLTAEMLACSDVLPQTIFPKKLHRPTPWLTETWQLYIASHWFE